VPHDDLVWIKPSVTRADDARRWADGLDLALPSEALKVLGVSSRQCVDGWPVPVEPVPQLERYVHALRLRAAFTDVAPTSSRLPFSYHLLPSFVRDMVAHAIGRWKFRQVRQWAKFPCWPLDLSADFLADLAGLDNRVSVRGRTPVLLTHDLDSAEGVTNFLKHFTDLEERAGARSHNFVVPCGYPLDAAKLREIVARGHKIGVHGYDHSNKTPFADGQTRKERLDSGLRALQPFQAEGYRAPSLLRTETLLQNLAGRYRFDSSIPTSGGLFPIPNNGCASARPFLIGGLWELPLSLPRDGSLRFLGYSPAQILQLWKEGSLKISQSGGIVVLLTHCERRFSGNPKMLRIYEEFLEFVAASEQFVFSSSDEIIAAAEAKQGVASQAA